MNRCVTLDGLNLDRSIISNHGKKLRKEIPDNNHYDISPTVSFHSFDTQFQTLIFTQNCSSNFSWRFGRSDFVVTLYVWIVNSIG